MGWTVMSPPLYRMAVMSLLVLVLSWGSMGLEAATAVVSAAGQAPGPWDVGLAALATASRGRP